MELAQYAHRAGRLDRLPDGLEGLRLALLGVAGEAGSAASEAKKSHRDSTDDEFFRASLVEELGDVLWYVNAVARRLDVSLADVAEANLEKIEGLFGTELVDGATLDDDAPIDQQLPRLFDVEFVEERTDDGLAIVRMLPQSDEVLDMLHRRQRDRGLPVSDQLGDNIDDNAFDDDGYRYHDIFHLGHVAVLGWSPVIRSLLGVKRVYDEEIDRNEDGARAIAIEEGIVAIVFNFLAERGFVVEDHVSYGTVKLIRSMVRGREVANHEPVRFVEAYRQGLEAFKTLRGAQGGVVTVDMERGRLDVRTGGS